MPTPTSSGSSVGITRRNLLAAGLGWLGARTLDADACPFRRAFLPRRACYPVDAVPVPDAAPPLLDLHVHLFGVGEGGTGCRMARSITDGLLFRGLVFALQLRVSGTTLDARYEQVLAQQLTDSGLDGAAILGQDAASDRKGQPDGARTWSRQRPTGLLGCQGWSSRVIQARK